MAAPSESVVGAVIGDAGGRLEIGEGFRHLVHRDAREIAARRLVALVFCGKHAIMFGQDPADARKPRQKLPDCSFEWRAGQFRTWHAAEGKSFQQNLVVAHAAKPGAGDFA